MERLPRTGKNILPLPPAGYPCSPSLYTNRQVLSPFLKTSSLYPQNPKNSSHPLHQSTTFSFPLPLLPPAPRQSVTGGALEITAISLLLSLSLLSPLPSALTSPHPIPNFGDDNCSKQRYNICSVDKTPTNQPWQLIFSARPELLRERKK